MCIRDSTSTDVALCAGGAPLTTAGEIAGLPLRLPLIDIHTVGAGGGSLAAVDAGGALLVGPQSAGANPGPAAYHADYGRWRAMLDAHFPAGRATVSDANLVLGRLDPARFLGGTMPVSYTHLDVYKRQPPGCGPRPRRSLAASMTAGCCSTRARCWPVSYTHLAGGPAVACRSRCPARARR